VTTAQARLPRSTPPAQPTDADMQLLLFTQGVELAARDLYKKAVESAKYSDDEAAMLKMFGEHHNSYAQAMNGLIGKVATNKRNDSLYSTHVGQLASAQSAYAALQSLENTLAATNTDILGQLLGTDGARVLASIITTEARMAAVFGTLPALNLTTALNSSANSLAPKIAQANEATTESTVSE
jgi:superoxide dismutase